MTIRLYNTLTRSKDAFEPADPRRVTLYVCGPTVYNRAHIGNARPAVVFDLLYRLLKRTYGDGAVVYARNITDVDDKINAAAAAQGVPISAITAEFEQHYVNDMGALGVARPTAEPHATAHIPQIIEIISRLIANGAAYAAEGHVLFHVPAFKAYGELSRRNQDEVLAGARVDVAPYKKDASDFVLWKPSTPDLPGWESPWGRGRPGWHIECSAMIDAVFGGPIDIHGGGQDLIFPHHENEIAQSRAAFQTPRLARVWMHNGFLNMGKDKMSKSLGNIALVSELLAAGHSGAVLRLALLSAHYRQPLEWTDELLAREKARLEGFENALRLAGDNLPLAEPPTAFLDALADDLNTPEALSALSETRKAITTATSDAERGHHAASLAAALHLLGLPTAHVAESVDDAPVQKLVDARIAAKQAKNWAEADRLRDALKAMGVVLEDRKDGSVSWRRA
jgi:cysteinyl-tRNA synthetase